MRALNKFIKAIAMIPIHLLVLICSWLLSFAVTAVIIAAIGFIWSLITPLPEVILSKFWLIYLIATIPLTLIFFIDVETDIIKEDNSEHWKKRLRMK